MCKYKCVHVEVRGHCWESDFLSTMGKKVRSEAVKPTCNKQVYPLVILMTPVVYLLSVAQHKCNDGDKWTSHTCLLRVSAHTVASITVRKCHRDYKLCF